MKRFLLIAALIGSSFLTSSHATDPNNSPSAVLEAFHGSIHGASDIRWERMDELYKVTFLRDGRYRSLFYTADGGLIAEAQYLSLTQLPAALQASLRAERQNRWITNLFAVTVDGKTRYYVTLEDADTATLLKSAGARKWTVYQTSEK